jgi:serine protease Do
MTLAPASEVGLDVDGLAVVEVDPTGPAAQSGIRVGDVILQAGGTDVATAQDLEAGVDTAEGEGRRNVLLKLRTGENTRFVALPVDEDRG